MSPIDGSFAVHDSEAYDALAALIGTTFGNPNDKPAIAGDLEIAVTEGGKVVMTTADLNENDPDSSGAALTYTVTAIEHGKVLVDGKTATSFTQLQLENGEVSFRQDGSAETEASFTVSLSDKSGLTATATVTADVTVTDHAPIIKSPSDINIAGRKSHRH